MTIFDWKGVDKQGKKVKGTREADNPKSLRLALRKDGVLVTEVDEHSGSEKQSAGNIDVGKLFRRVSSGEIAMETKQMATLLAAGIPLIETLNAMIEQQENPLFKAVLIQVRTRVNEGTTFADALKQHPNVFNTLYTSMVAAGEVSGHLETVLERLALFLEGQNRLRSKVISALAYPAFMAIIGILIISIMMIVVVPKVTAIFESFKQTLPWYTRVLIWVSDLITNYKWFLLAGIVLMVWGFRKWRRSEKGRRRWDGWMLKLPQIRDLTIMVAVSRFARTLGTLLAGGVPLLTALEISKNLLGNVLLMEDVEEARGSIREGEGIAVTLRRGGKFPPIAIHMIAVGERSGQLEQMLDHVAGAFDTRVENRLTTMTALLEPLMIVIMGGVAGLIAFAILMPLLKFNDFIQ